MKKSASNSRSKEFKKEGVCVGLADGKEVIRDQDINKVMDTLKKNYPNQDIAISSIPKHNKIFIL